MDAIPRATGVCSKCGDPAHVFDLKWTHADGSALCGVVKDQVGRLRSVQRGGVWDWRVLPMNDFARLLNATDEEWDDYIGCPHTGKTYRDVSRLTGVEHVRCRDCHSVVEERAS